MKLYEAFQDTGFHTVLMTTFGVEFGAFESIALSRFRGAACRNVILVCDAGMLGLTLAEGRLPKHAGASYLVSKAYAAGVFHPKVTVQLGRKNGRLIISSANATAAGLAGNLELAARIDCTDGDSGERRLVLAGWRYGLRFLDTDQTAVRDKLRWARERAAWLDPDAAAVGPVELSDGTTAAFLATGETRGIGSRFIDVVDARRAVERLVVISPYWDEDLAALAFIRNAFRPRKTVLLVDTERRLFPAEAVRDKAIRVCELQGFEKKHFPDGNRRFIHAKMVVVTIGGMDHVLVGSPNCTFAALGAANDAGLNEEAALYRRLPEGRLFDALGLLNVIEESPTVDVRKIPKRTSHNKLPLNEAAEADPGAFELAFDRLIWKAASEALAKAFSAKHAALELLDAHMKPLGRKLELLNAEGREHTFRLAQGEARLAFARLRYVGGKLTGLAIVACVEELRNQTHDPLTAKTERALRDLERGDEEGLWLLETIQELAAPQLGTIAKQAPRVSAARGGKAPPSGPVDLDYETFMRGRRRRIEPTEAERNSHVGSHLSYVRASLNRWLGLTSAAAPAMDEEDDEDILNAIDTGDETGQRSDPIGEGVEPLLHKRPLRSPKEQETRRCQADAYAILNAVDDFTEDLRQPNRALDSVDMLRLRTMIAIVAVTAWPNFGARAWKPSVTQVLPSSDKDGGPTWPRLMGRTLTTIFQGPHPALARMRFDAAQERLPDDILETWAHCIWASQAALAASRLDPGCANLTPFLTKLVVAMRQMLRLSAEEMATPAFLGCIENLDKRFGPRLRIPTVKAACLTIHDDKAAAAPAPLAKKDDRNHRRRFKWD